MEKLPEVVVTSRHVGGLVQRVHFGPADLARIKVVPTGGPVVETLFAMELLALRRGGPRFGPWREAARQRFGAVVRPVGHAALTEALFRDPDAPVRRPGDVGDFHDAAIAPYWAQVRARLEADREHRGRVFAGGGAQALLDTLHPAVGWRAPALEVAHERDEDIRPGGAGLVVVPSLFLVGGPTVFTKPGAAPRLVYPVPLDGATAAVLWRGRPCGRQALGALVGRTRAEILHALGEHRTTTELGRSVGISTAAASQHATVLRAAGLITSRRRLNTVQHSLTALGSTLVRGRDTGVGLVGSG